ncbi:MAG TPA: hypothetical protein VKA85_04145 [Candidatus Limnocylindrales bacterium]|nr:hypothetical protein [Candidatus Limnocylindrales bacterium]
MPRYRLATWLRRGLEAAVVAAVVAIASLAGNRLSAGGSDYAIPTGLAGAVVLAPAVVALGALATAYPIAMSPTRSDAVFGAVVGFLVGADLTIILSPAAIILPGGSQLPGGALVGLLATAPAIVGIIASQVVTPLGFGRRAGAGAAILASVVAALVLAFVAAQR